MVTLLAPDTNHEDQIELPAISGSDPLSARAEWLWTLFGLALLGAFFALVVEDFPLRSLIAAH